ncbi:phage head closure protein, partial [Proteus mirabilis]|nr:phage head closure protein [Proteus mirabilis]
QQVQSEATTRILIRYIADIDTSMRIVWGKRIFNIISIIDPYERHRELQLMCKEGVNDG